MLIFLHRQFPSPFAQPSHKMQILADFMLVPRVRKTCSYDLYLLAVAIVVIQRFASDYIAP